MVQVLLRQAAFQVGPGVDARGGMALDVEQVAAEGVGGGAPEMVEADLVQRGRGCVGGDVAAVLGTLPVGLHDHGHGVPADVGLEAPLDGPVARVLGLLPERDGIQVGGVGPERQVGAGTARVIHHLVQQELGALRAGGAQDGIDGLDPLAGLFGIQVGSSNGS